MTALVEGCGLALPGRLEETALVLRAGELACLIGPNGSGKTSLLHALAGVGHPSGSVRVGGAEPKTVGPEQRQRLLTYLPASRDIRWPLTAADLIALGLPAGADRSVMAATVSALQLEPFMQRRVDRLSTGERSRVLIARALVAEPKLLLLDEPAANLDPLWQLRLMDHLQARARSGQALLVAMHDLDLAGRYADRLIVMRGGRIEAAGHPETLLGSAYIPSVFGIERADGRWRPVY